MPGHEPFELLLGHFHNLLLCPGPLVSTIQQSLIKQQKSISFPDEARYLVRLSAAEHKQNILLKRVNVQLLANDCTQAVDTLTKVCIAASDVDPVEAGSVIQHEASSSAPGPAQSSRHPEFPEYRPLWSAGDWHGTLPVLESTEPLPAATAVPAPMQYRLLVVAYATDSSNSAPKSHAQCTMP